MSIYLNYILIFFAVFFVDVIWAFYISAVSSRKALKAAALSMIIYGLSVFSFLGIVDDYGMLIPAVLGAFSGTFLTVKWEEKREK
jgi:hypothetical protein